MDFTQAYDCVYWNFLRSMLSKMGFGQKWLEVGVFSNTISILLKGSPTKEFLVKM